MYNLDTSQSMYRVYTEVLSVTNYKPSDSSLGNTWFFSVSISAWSSSRSEVGVYPGIQPFYVKTYTHILVSQACILSIHSFPFIKNLHHLPIDIIHKIFEHIDNIHTLKSIHRINYTSTSIKQEQFSAYHITSLVLGIRSEIR